MELDRMISMFSSLETAGQVSVLATLAFELTIWARDTYMVGSEAVSQPKQLRVYNEMQHKLLGQLCKTLSHDEKRYPNDVFLTIIFDMAKDVGALSNVHSTLKKLLEAQRIPITEEREKERIYA